MLRSGPRGPWMLGALLVIGVTFGLGVLPLLQPARSVEAPEVLPFQHQAQPFQHPRVFFSSEDIARLRQQAQTSHREIWEPILSFSRSERDSSPPGPPAEGDLDGYRNAGNQVIAFAFAHVITADPAYLDLARRHLLRYTEWRDWGDEGGYGDRDLGFHHMLLGNAIAYDWIYNDLPEADRATIGDNLRRRAQESYEASSSAEYRWNNWWREAYTQNHNWSNHSALGVAALVLEGEDPRASQWLDRAVQNMTKIRYMLEGIGDGSWHEGIPYQSYGLTMSLPFLTNLRKLKGMDLIPHTYLRNYTYWRVYNSLPGSSRFVLSYGDLEWSWANSYSPEGLLRFAAAEYRDGHAEWMAQSIARSTARTASVFTTPWSVFEFLYYDPSVKLQLPDDLSPDRTFPDLESVIWRTGWGETDLVFGLKSGAPGGRFAYTAFTRGKQYPFDPESDVDLFHTGHDHDDAGTFYLYRGGVDLTSETIGYQSTETYYHNTVLVDGLDQYRAPDSKANSRRDPGFVEGTDGGLGEVYGTRDLSFLVADAPNPYRYTDPKSGKPGSRMMDQFRRHVLFVKPGYLVMVDSVRADSPRQFDWVSHFARSVSVEGDWVKGIADRGQVLGIKVLAPASFRTSTGNDGKPYLRIHPESKMAATRFVMVLYPTDEAGWQNRPTISSLGDDGRATGVQVRLNGTQDHLIRYGDQAPARVGEYSFEAQSASVSKDQVGAVRRIFLGRGTGIADSGGARELIRAPRELRELQVDYQDGSLSVHGEADLSGVAVYAPGVAADRVTVNGRPAPAARNGDYLELGR